LDIDSASPIGMVLNELLTNTYKHAIQKSNQASVKITFKSEDAEYYLLTYQDNGPGIPGHIKFSQPKTLGLQLITGLTKQLRGTVNYSKGEFGIFTIRFKNKIARKQE
jgi:two-component sensor histidine kinase